MLKILIWLLLSSLSANWDGFNDGECGIHGYAWAVGTSVCSSDISNFTDPHVTHPHPQDWTHLGLAKHLHLAEGPYFVTVQVSVPGVSVCVCVCVCVCVWSMQRDLANVVVCELRLQNANLC